MKSLSENSRRQVCKPLPLRGYTGWSQLAAGRKDNAYRPISRWTTREYVKPLLHTLHCNLQQLFRFRRAKPRRPMTLRLDQYLHELASTRFNPSTNLSFSCSDRTAIRRWPAASRSKFAQERSTICSSTIIFSQSTSVSTSIGNRSKRKFVEDG